jgi:hypothetical protein
VSDLKAWISARRPVSPVELGPRIDASGVTAVSVVGLTKIARDALEQARLSPGRVRSSAFQLLTADALITYACELALDGEDSDLVLEVIMQHSAASS